MASIYHDMAGVWAEQGMDDTALEIYGQSLSLRRQNLQPEDPLIATTLHALGNLYNRMGCHMKAQHRYQEAFWSDNPELIDIRNSLAGPQSQQGGAWGTRS